MAEKIEPASNDVIRLLIHGNRKIERKKSRLRFALYEDGMTFADYENTVRQKLGNREARKCKNDLKWDSAPGREFIRIERKGQPIELSIPPWLQYHGK